MKLFKFKYTCTVLLETSPMRGQELEREGLFSSVEVFLHWLKVWNYSSYYNYFETVEQAAHNASVDLYFYELAEDDERQEVAWLGFGSHDHAYIKSGSGVLVPHFNECELTAKRLEIR